MPDNICRFVPYQTYHDQIHILHFVLETKPQTDDIIHRQAHYTLHYMLSGSARLKVAQYQHEIHAGDLFLTPPAVIWSLETLESNTQYLYLSFLGRRANAIIDQLRITPKQCVFSGFRHLESLWLSGLQSPTSVSALRSEGILLCSFSEIGARMLSGTEDDKPVMNAAIIVRKYVDDHFSDPNLTLETAGRHCGYHPKYISTVFPKVFRVRFTDYLNTLRIHHACMLMEQGLASIKDIAAMCGYSDAMYFSRVFKRQMGCSPKEHCAALRHQPPR